MKIFLLMLFLLFGCLSRKWIWTRNIYVFCLTFLIIASESFSEELFTQNIILFLGVYWIYYLFKVKKSLKRATKWYGFMLWYLLLAILSGCYFTYKTKNVDVQFIHEFAYIRLNEDNSVDLGPIFFGHRISRSKSEKVQEIHLKQGESISMSDGFHASKQLVYRGVQEGKLVFENKSHFHGFGRNNSEQWQEHVLPYTKEEYAKGKEKEVLDELLRYFNDYLPLYNNWIGDLIKSLGKSKKELLNQINLETVDEDTCRLWPDFEWIKKKERVNYSYVEKKGCALKCLSKDMHRDYYGNCLSCGIKYVSWTSEEECLKCPNRQYIDDKCIFKNANE